MSSENKNGLAFWLIQGGFCLAPLYMGSTDTVVSSPTRKEVAMKCYHSVMLSFGEFIAVVSLVVSSFMLGYRIGRDKKSDETDLKNRNSRS